MAKKILVLNGSPRVNGNTAALIESFTQGAALVKGARNNVTRFDLKDMHIQPCMGCYGGGADKKSPCVQKDDMDRIYKAFNEADIVVFASPLYYWFFSGQLKIVIDRLFAVTESNAMDAPYKECMMLVAAEDDSEENFEPIVRYYRSILRNLGWKDAGMILAGGVKDPGDIEGKPSLEAARRLGMAIR